MQKLLKIKEDYSDPTPNSVLSEIQSTSWERADLLALLCGVYCEFATFPLVSWVRCGT